MKNKKSKRKKFNRALNGLVQFPVTYIQYLSFEKNNQKNYITDNQIFKFSIQSEILRKSNTYIINIHWKHVKYKIVLFTMI